jgi:hypothetical protein
MSECQSPAPSIYFVSFLFLVIHFSFFCFIARDCTETHDVLFHPSLHLPLAALIVSPCFSSCHVFFCFLCLLCFNILWDTIFELRLDVLAGFVWTRGRVIRCCIFDLHHQQVGRVLIMPHHDLRHFTTMQWVDGMGPASRRGRKIAKSQPCSQPHNLTAITRKEMKC